ncbi:MAG TPA: hypothetical protein VK541_18885, partial [Pedobacter sp.]|uniref:putative immunity protein n=1 Tax=Pedobacter sp. TaxID=1411316 RepID=UPI002C61CD8E
IAEHHGGPVTINNHRKLMRWARGCSEHVLSLLELSIDERLVYALQVAREWEDDMAPTGKAMKASLAAHAAARDASNPVLTAIARSVGQAVATAHMADHSMGAALYALKALKLAGKSREEEREWQIRQLQHLPAEIATMVRDRMAEKGKSFKL